MNMHGVSAAARATKDEEGVGNGVRLDRRGFISRPARSPIKHFIARAYCYYSGRALLCKAGERTRLRRERRRSTEEVTLEKVDTRAIISGSGTALRGGFPASSRNKLPAVPLLSRAHRRAAFTPIGEMFGISKIDAVEPSESAEVNICCHNIAITAKSHRDAIYTWGA